MKAFADLYAAARRDDPNHGQGRGDGSLLPRPRRRRTRRGPSTSSAVASRARPCLLSGCGCGHRELAGRARVAVRRELPPRRRRGRNDRAYSLPRAEAASDRRSPTGSRTDLLPLRGLNEERQQGATCWRRGQALDARQRFVWNKLITGEFRVGVSQLLVVRALAEVAELPTDMVAHRLMGAWEPTPLVLRGTRRPRRQATPRSSRAVSVLPRPPAGGRACTRLGPVDEWQAEVEVGRHPVAGGPPRGAGRSSGRGARSWSPTATRSWRSLADALPDGTVIDGEILPWKDGTVLPFARPAEADRPQDARARTCWRGAGRC